jgi:C4-type Zn-finger protein
MTPHITAPRSRIYEWYFERRSCPKCGELLSAPAYSEFLKHNNVRHTWLCNKCDYEFETLIWLNIPPRNALTAIRQTPSLASSSARRRATTGNPCGRGDCQIGK